MTIINIVKRVYNQAKQCQVGTIAVENNEVKNYEHNLNII